MRPGQSAGWGRHFAVFDSKRYRVETSRDDRTAIACVNDPKLALGLERIARKILAGASPVA